MQDPVLGFFRKIFSLTLFLDSVLVGVVKSLSPLAPEYSPCGQECLRLYGYSKRSTIFIDFPNGIHCVTTAGTLRDGITASFFYSSEKDLYQIKSLKAPLWPSFLVRLRDMRYLSFTISPPASFATLLFWRATCTAIEA